MGGQGECSPAWAPRTAAPALQALDYLLHPTLLRLLPAIFTLELQVWPYSRGGQAGVISALSGISETPEQAGVICSCLLRAGSSHATTWHAHAGSSSSAVDGSGKWSRRSHPDLEPPAAPGGLPKVAGALAYSCLKAVTSSFASVGMQDEKGSSLACLLHTSGTDMEPILQTVAHVPLPLEDFSKTRLPTADLQRFLKQRGDSREATNYVDEEPDSKQSFLPLKEKDTEGIQHLPNIKANNRSEVRL